MNGRWKLIGAGAAAVLVGTTAFALLTAQGATAAVTVYKSPTCGCCNAWIDHLREAGFTVEAVDVNDLRPIKAEHGVRPEFGSCHTAVIDGYVVEGHVPASDVIRMLTERPQIAGLAVPGMPIGSPGMEGPNPRPYNTLAFDRAGRTTVYAQH